MAYLLKSAHVVDRRWASTTSVTCSSTARRSPQVGEGLEASDGVQVIDAAGKYLVPGLVDMHVHFRDPGFEYKETIESGARAAVHGGFTDVATMPNTDPVTDNGAEVRYQIDRARHAGFCHVRPIGALTVGEKGQTLAEIGDMVMEGAVAFSDDGHGVQSAGMMRTCMEYVSQFDKVVSAHCEIESLTTHGVINEGRASTRSARLSLGEELEIYRDIELCRMTGCALHIAHISTEKGLELVRAAKAEGLPVTCEVTPHHLFLCEDDITDAYDTNLKMNPPLRRASDAAALRAGHPRRLDRLRGHRPRPARPAREGLRVGDRVLWHRGPGDVAAAHAHQPRAAGTQRSTVPCGGHGREPAPLPAPAGGPRGGRQHRRPHARRPGGRGHGHRGLAPEPLQELRLAGADPHRRCDRRLCRRPPHAHGRRAHAREKGHPMSATGLGVHEFSVVSNEPAAEGLMRIVLLAPRACWRALGPVSS